jgi:hypothetical protein
MPSELDLGQTSWACPKGNSVGVFIFFPAFSPKIAWSYQVPCVADGFLRFTLCENV